MKKIETFLKKAYWYKFSGEFISTQKWDWYNIDDFKEYEKWDNAKKINRKMSAKHSKEFVTIYQVEKEALVDIFVDFNYNFRLFEDRTWDYFNFLSIILKRLWIKKNIYVYEKWKALKSNDFTDRFKQKSSQINEIIESWEFKSKNSYKLLFSDFSFIRQENIESLLEFNNKVFLWIIPLLEVLKNSKIPIYNGFFDSSLNKDFIEEYKEKIDLLKRYSWNFEEI